MTHRRLRVIDLTDDLALQASRLFVGLGAEVARIVLPADEPLSHHLHWHAGKQLIQVSSHDELDATVRGLLAGADVVIESGSAQSLRTLGLRADDLEAWAHVVHVVVTPFGLTGPRRDWTAADDTVVTASGGMTWLGGDSGQPPEPPPRQQGVQLAGSNAAIGALLALYARRHNGRGQLVDVSAQEAVAATLETGAIAWIHGRSVPGRTSGVYGHVAHRVFRAADGYLAGGYSGSPRMWDDLLAWMDEEGEAADLTEARWQDGDTRWQGRPHVDAVVAKFVASRRARPFAEEARRRALPWAEVSKPADLLDNPQLNDRQFLTNVGEAGAFTDVGFGWESPAMPRPVTLAAPQSISTAPNWPAARPTTTPRPETSRPRGAALDGVRVLDLTWVLAGPYVTKILGEHGADIVKVESEHRKDPTRFAPGMRLRPGAGPDDSGYFLNFNRNKRSLALNLRTEAGQDLLRRLVPTVDVVVENFSPGVLAKWGLDYPNLRELNPDVVLVSMAGVGQTGPWRTAVTFADTLAAMSGLTHETGRDSRPPQGLTFGLGDMVAANTAVIGALELLLRGEGGHVDMSQLEAMAASLGPALLESQVPHTRSAVSDEFPARIIRAAGDDRWLAVGLTTRECLRAALKVITGEDLAGIDLEPELERQTAETDADEMATLLQERGVAAHAVRDGRDLIDADSQLAARGFYVDLVHPIAGTVAHEGVVAGLTDTPGGLWEPAPLLGQHTDELLTELLGLAESEIIALRSEGVLS